jgi:hypothetical protein
MRAEEGEPQVDTSPKVADKKSKNPFSCDDPTAG